MRLDDDLKYFESPEFKDLLATYEAALEAGSQAYMEADELTDIAEYYSMVCHDDERADEAISLALQLHPDAVDPQIFKARQYMLAGEIGTAEDICRSIEDQQHREVLFLRAELMLRQDRVKQAAAMLQQASESVAEDRDFFLYDSAYVFIDYHLYEEALCFALQLEEMAPDWYKTWQIMADVYLGKEDNRTALGYIERMLDVDPFSTEAWNWSAEAHCGLQEYDEALSSTEYALAVDPENERALQLKAWILLQQGKFTDAQQLYEQLIDWNPLNEQNWLYLSYCLLDADRLDEAIDAIEKAEALSEDISPEQAGIYEQHAQILSRKGDVKGALARLDEAQTYFEPDAEIPDLDLLRARVYAENCQPEPALDCIRQACLHHEEQQEAIFFQGALMLFECEYYSLAVEMFAELMNHTQVPEQQAALFAYQAYCYMKMENVSQTLSCLKSAAAAPEKLRELFAEEFPYVLPDEYYDYYYHRVYGRWPEKE